MWRGGAGRRAAADGRGRLDGAVIGDAVAVDDDAVASRLRSGLERLVDYRLVAGPSGLPGRSIHADEADAGRDAEGGRRLVLERAGHEVAEDRRRVMSPLLLLTKRARIV